MTDHAPQPPQSSEHLFEDGARSATLRYTPEDEAWNIFTTDGVYVATFTRVEGSDDKFELESHRTGPLNQTLTATHSDWPSLVVRALVEAESFEA